MEKQSSNISKDLLVVTGPDGEKIEVNYRIIKNAALTIRSMNHPLRKSLIELVESKKEIRVMDICKKLKLDQSVASKQLGILRRARILMTRRDGRQIFYSVNGKRIKEVSGLAAQLL